MHRAKSTQAALKSTLRAALLLLGAFVVASARAQPAAGPNPWWKGYYESAPLVRAPDGRHLRVYCMGAGRPTVVLESGAGDGAWSWRTVQAAMAKTTRVCSYDRAGLGLSDEAHGHRGLEAMAADLAVVVQAVGRGKPVVLVGHSLGGAIVRQYAYRHAEKVAGIVMVDSSSDHQTARFRAINELLAQPGLDPVRHCLDLTEKGHMPEGSADYQQCVGPPPADMPAGFVHFHVQYGQSPVHFREIFAEIEAAVVDGSNDAEADAARRPLGDVPMVVLTAGGASNVSFLSPAEQARFELARYQMHNEIAGLSTRARHRVVPDSSHYIQYDRPQAVIEAVAEVVADARTRGERVTFRLRGSCACSEPSEASPTTSVWCFQWKRSRIWQSRC